MQLDKSINTYLPTFSVSDFVATTNQIFDLSINNVVVEGEIANLRLSKGKWLYFDLKDDGASVRCFAVAYQIGGVFEDGMMVSTVVSPRLHPQYGFSLTVNAMKPVGEGDIKKANDLLRQKLAKEGLFEESRKRELPTLPTSVGLVTSAESAAYGDFIKVLKSRWGGIEITLYDTLVQGSEAPAELVRRINEASGVGHDVVVITRGGGSTDDLMAFSDEFVVRAIASSRVPTLVAIGHERDESLAELVADKRASTPSNAAELLVPDKREITKLLSAQLEQISQLLVSQVTNKMHYLSGVKDKMRQLIKQIISDKSHDIKLRQSFLSALNPRAILERGYVLVYDGNDNLITSIKNVNKDDNIRLGLIDGQLKAKVSEVIDDRHK